MEKSLAFVKWTYRGFAASVLVGLIVAMVAESEPGAFTALIATVAGAVVFGFLSVADNWIEPRLGARRFVEPFLWMTGFAALSLIGGNVYPVLGFAVLSAMLFGLYHAGAWLARQREPR